MTWAPQPEPSGLRTRVRVGAGVRVRVGFKDVVGVQNEEISPSGAFGAHGPSGAFSAHGLLKGGGGGGGELRQSCPNPSAQEAGYVCGAAPPPPRPRAPPPPPHCLASLPMAGGAVGVGPGTCFNFHSGRGGGLPPGPLPPWT